MIPPTRILEAQAALHPVPRKRRRNILSHLYGNSRTLSACSSLLKEYPEDLLCAAQEHYRHRRIVPTASALIAFMEPEMRFRRAQLSPLPLAGEG